MAVVAATPDAVGFAHIDRNATASMKMTPEMYSLKFLKPIPALRDLETVAQQHAAAAEVVQLAIENC